jgi:inner membrane protein COX18
VTMATLLTRARPLSRFIVNRHIGPCAQAQFQSLHDRHNGRTFSSTPKNHSVLEPILTTTHDALALLHDTTLLPWALTLPLAALTVRTVLTPLSISSRQSLQKQASLNPLLTSWQHAIRHKIMVENGHLGPAAVERLVGKEFRAKRKEIYKRHGIRRWLTYAVPLAQLPVWLCVLETVRGMCGAHKGLLGMMVTSVPETIKGTAAAGSPSAEGSSIMLDGVGGQGGILDSSTELLGSVSTPTTPLDTVSTIIPLEPSMTTEGMLWFTDLTASDPLLILPFVLSAIMLINISHNTATPGTLANLTARLSGKTPAATNISVVQISPFRRRLTNSLKVFALAVGPLTLQVPTGMLVYWISSSSLAYLQGHILDVFLPLKPPPSACKPPKSNL